MSRLIKICCGLAVGGALGLAASLVGVSALAGDAPAAAPRAAHAPVGRMSAREVRNFAEFPIYGGLPDLASVPLITGKRTSPQLLAQAARGRPPIVTVGDPPNSAESRGHEIVPDFVNLIYGSCPAADRNASTPRLCSSPLQVQIWRSCNRSLDDYEALPGVALPREDLTIRGTRAADFGDRLELYAGSVTIVIFADGELARRAASALRPLNALAAAEASRVPAGRLPAPARGGDCA